MRNYLHRVKQTAEQVQAEVRNAFRGVLNVVKSQDEIPKAQVSALADETLQDVEVMQQFGFTSALPPDTDVVVPIGGKTTHSIVIATENGTFRVKNLQSGEVAIYDQSGSTIILRQGKVIEIDCDTLKINAKTKVAISSPLVETDQVFTAQGQINGNGGMSIQGGTGATFSGEVNQSGGSFSTDGDVRAGGISLKAHKHSGDSGGETSSAKA